MLMLFIRVAFADLVSTLHRVFSVRMYSYVSRVCVLLMLYRSDRAKKISRQL